MDNQDLISRIRDLVKPYSHNDAALAALNEDSDFIKDLKINSANLVDVVLDVEEAYDIVIDNESMEGMLTVGAAIRIINEKLGNKK